MSAGYSFDKNAGPILSQGARDAVAEIAIRMQREGKRELSTPGTGKKHSGLKYRSSRALDSPTVQTGHLRRSVQNDLSELNNPKVATARTGTNVKYGRFLEYGTKNMAPRPWMRRTIVRVKKFVPAIVKKRMAIALTKIGVK